MESQQASIPLAEADTKEAEQPITARVRTADLLASVVHDIRARREHGRINGQPPLRRRRLNNNNSVSNMFSMTSTPTSTAINRGVEFPPFEKAHALAIAFCKKNDIDTQKKWRKLGKKRPRNLPSNPWETYKGKGYISCSHWLTGTSTSTRDHLPFTSSGSSKLIDSDEEAQLLARDRSRSRRNSK
jgi:hypothetical protein